MEEASSFWVHGVIAVTQLEQCVARADARVMLASGIMDVWMTNRYHMNMKIENFLLSTRAKFGTLWGENNIVQVTGAHVSFDVPDGLDPATVTALTDSHFLAGVGEAEPEGLGLASFSAIEPDVGNALATDSRVLANGAEVLLKVRLEGRLGDGTIVQSNEYYFPLHICYGCLYMRVVQDCTDLSDANDMRPPCRIGENEGVDCRFFTVAGIDASDIGN